MRQVDLGPFKHTVDDGLELRKAVFECMDALLEKCMEVFNVALFALHSSSELTIGRHPQQPGLEDD